MHGRLTVGIAALRTLGFAALLLLLWNPVSIRRLPASEPPLVLLDASLSMDGYGANWRAAQDSARALARAGVIWRFGASVARFDSTPPGDGTTRLAPALTAAAARGAPVVVVTDGAIEDARDIPPDLLRDTRIVLVRRNPFPDAFVAAVEGPHRIGPEDTLRLEVSYGMAGKREAGTGKRETGNGKREATLTVRTQGRSLTSRRVVLPDSGIASTTLALPASRFPHPGWAGLEVRLDDIHDSEPRDDARLFVVEVTSVPAIVVLAAPPDWDLRFLARTLSDVARAPVKMFAQVEPASAAWRWLDAATLHPVTPAEIRTAVARARLVVEGGEPASFGQFAARGAVLRWATHGGQDGDWYFDQPPVSPAAAALAGIAWDSLPPAISLEALPADSTAAVVLTARLARRGPSRAAVLLSEHGGTRRATIAASGLYRWVFRGGASAEAYRSLVAALTDWLLTDRAVGGAPRATPEALSVANGLPLMWRWTGSGPPRSLTLRLAHEGRERVDTLRFDATGRGALHAAPGMYRYSFEGGTEQGMVAVETYSDEWRPGPTTVAAQRGGDAAQVRLVSARDRWWLFALVLIVFVAEWAWRRRQGLP